VYADVTVRRAVTALTNAAVPVVQASMAPVSAGAVGYVQAAVSTDTLPGLALQVQAAVAAAITAREHALATAATAKQSKVRAQTAAVAPVPSSAGPRASVSAVVEGFTANYQQQQQQQQQQRTAPSSTTPAATAMNAAAGGSSRRRVHTNDGATANSNTTATSTTASCALVSSQRLHTDKHRCTVDSASNCVIPVTQS
jgi:hypothetical protein